MINEEKTQQLFGYQSNELADTSQKKVVWNCSRCPKEKIYTFNYLNNKKVEKELCQKCCHAHRIGKSNSEKEQPKKTKKFGLPDHGVNVERTLELFNYDPHLYFYEGGKGKHGPYSRSRVVLNCCSCGKESTPKRCDIHSSKYMTDANEKNLESKVKCIGCYTRERRKGKKDSAETRMKKMEAQQRRREVEKDAPSWTENEQQSMTAKITDENYLEPLIKDLDPKEVSTKDDYQDYSDLYPWNGYGRLAKK